MTDRLLEQLYVLKAPEIVPDLRVIDECGVDMRIARLGVWVSFDPHCV